MQETAFYPTDSAIIMTLGIQESLAFHPVPHITSILESHEGTLPVSIQHRTILRLKLINNLTELNREFST